MMHLFVKLYLPEGLKPPVPVEAEAEAPVDAEVLTAAVPDAVMEAADAEDKIEDLNRLKVSC